MSNPKHILKAITFWTILIIFFASVASYLIVSVNGYQVNWRTLKFEPTGLLLIKTNPEGAFVLMNGLATSYKTPVNVPRLIAGRYDVEITKNSYRPWNRTIEIEPGQVSDLSFISLFLRNISIEQGTADDKKILSVIKPDTDLMINDIEIYRVKNNTPILVTRLSQSVKAVRWYPDDFHIAYQVGNQIQIAEQDGRGTETLLTLDSEDPTTIAFTNNGDAMLVKQLDHIYRAKIR